MASWTAWDKRCMCIALYNRELYHEGKSPVDHFVLYDKGWFELNEGPRHRRKDITNTADRLLKRGFRAIYDLSFRSYAFHAKKAK